jgi:F-type H+-transporting ATPase subunit b
MRRFLILAVCGLLAAYGAAAVAADEETEKSAPTATAAQPAGETAAGEAHGKAADEAHPPAAGTAGEPVSGEHAAEHAAGDHAAGDHAGGDHAHHDPHDLSHGDGSAALRAAQELRFDRGIATFAVFLLLLAILAKFAWGPIAAGLDKREETIARQIAEAKQAAATASKQLQEYERKLAAATEEARAIVTQARTDAAAAKESLLSEAQAAATRERERAVADIATAKNQALREIADLSVSTAVSLAGKIIRREVKPEDHDRLIADSLQQFSQLN